MTDASGKNSKRATRTSLAAWGTGARFKGPGGVQGQSPWWGPRGRSPRKLLYYSMQKQHFQRKRIAFDETERTLWSYRPPLLHARDVWPEPPQSSNPFSRKRVPCLLGDFASFCSNYIPSFQNFCHDVLPDFLQI